jgi:hypothetical protein
MMQLHINALQIRQCHLLPQDHLIEADDKVRIQETTMEDAQTQTSPDELEVIEMLRVHPRCGVDLKCIFMVRGALEEAVERIEHLVREEKEEFPTRPSFMSETENGSWILSHRVESPP